MFEWYQEWQRKRRLELWFDRRYEVMERILFWIFPLDTPYLLDAGFSFLQPQPGSPEELRVPIGFQLRHPIRLDLLLPDYPLAIDVLDPRDRSHFDRASSFISRFDWEWRQREMAEKVVGLTRYRVPYLQIQDDDPVDEASLMERIRALIGKPPR
jgi:hypothetical protein